MADSGAALMAIGEGKGEDRARVAAEQAINSRLLDVTIDGARGILFNVTGGPDLSLFEVNQAAAIIRETTHPMQISFWCRYRRENGRQYSYHRDCNRIRSTTDPATTVVTSCTDHDYIVRIPLIDDSHRTFRSAKSEGTSENKRREEERVSVNNLDIPAFASPLI